jgi:hypothetical protein
MDRALLLELVEALGLEFERRQMLTHLESLRLFYLGVRHQLDHGRNRSIHVSWNEDMTLDWLAVLRVPPYQAHYPTRPRGYRCTCAAGLAADPSGRDGDWSHLGKGAAQTLFVFPGGSKTRCGGCGAVWLELDDDAVAGPAPKMP